MQKKAKKTTESINSKLQLVMKSGEFSLGQRMMTTTTDEAGTWMRCGRGPCSSVMIPLEETGWAARRDNDDSGKGS